ncbi:response regulator transcription factor [Fulvivirga sp. M361]|uniref:LytR/AlgR family response regulator transcription factor n=1 Tax=Fulvivirga sp. M361 TaxID=2594266 RepID=UPI00117BC824|nr:LytTR family DNA-binding domain-containing protein [Fulvivirga sp. M361]TRX60717.1 response regulator transcription factor [Fulvivirga sp. M361]
MDVIIVEDERLSAERLRHLLHQIDRTIDVRDMLPSLHSAIEWFRDNSPPDLVFLDIQLGDGTAFDLLRSVNNSPYIVFTTAYDEYALKAFKYNSIEYLLKPIDKPELEKALAKFNAINLQNSALIPQFNTIERIGKVVKGEYKKRFLIKIGEQYLNVSAEDIAYLHYENGSCLLTTAEGKELPLDYSLDQLEDILNPMDFFRINRQFLIRADAIHEIHTYFNSRLLLRLTPVTGKEVIVSRDRVSDFKRWMDC